MRIISEASEIYLRENYLEECTMRQYIRDSFESGAEFYKNHIIERLEFALKMMQERRHDVAGLGAPISLLKEIIEEN